MKIVCLVLAVAGLLLSIVRVILIVRRGRNDEQ